MRITIDRDLLPMKGHYFLFNAGVSPVQPFMPLIAKDLNFSSTAVGTIHAVLPFTGMIAKPVFGAIADRFRLHKIIFVVFQVLIIIGFFNVQFLPALDGEVEDKIILTCGAETNFEVCLREPDKHSDCLIQDILRESSSNRTVRCSMKCDLSSGLRTELCGPWKADPKICSDELATGPEGVEYAHYSEEEGGSSAQLRYSVPSDELKLEFVASVPMKHTLQVANCVYFRVAEAELNDETRHIPYCRHLTDTQCKITCDDSKLTELVKRQTSELKHREKEEETDEFLHYYQFWLLLLLSIISWVGMAVVGSLADAVCFELLGERASLYGYQRLWGSVGWGVFSILTGIVVDKFSTPVKANYTPAFYIMLVVMISDVVCSSSLKYEQTKVSCNLFKNVSSLLKNVWIDIFLIWCIILGMCVGVQWTFLFWHLEQLMGCDQRKNQKTLLGLIGGVQCFVGELPSFFMFSALVKKFGHVHLMSLIPFLIGVRFILYSILSNPWWILPVEVLQASVGLSFATMASYASIVAPPGCEATVQGLVGAIFEGIGVSFGSYCGGLIFHSYGGRGLFQIFAVIAFALCLVHGTVHYLLGQRERSCHTSDFNGVAKYASPNEVVAMLEET